MSENTSNITGDGNLVLQDINAGDITINIASNLDPDVKQKKESLKKVVNGLVEDLTQLKAQMAPTTQAGEFEPPDDEEYTKIKWRRLIQALRHKGCVLFIGPEISVDTQGNSLHREFYKEIVQDFDEIEYLENEGFFSPESDEEILYDMLDFYSKDFPKQNKIGRNLLEEFAQVPFDLIISLCPDDTMHRIYDDFAINHHFLAYDGTKQELNNGDDETPVIYNILGNAALNGRYIFTHENFYQYLNKVAIPSEIKKKIQDATHFLFVGFDFDKWYNRLLLFILDLEQSKGGGNRLIVGSKKIKVDIEKFIEKQFSFTFINDEYKKFAEWLTLNAAEAEILRNLNTTFIQNNFIALKNFSIKVSDEDKLEDLVKIEEQAKTIGDKIEKFKKRISN
ncbi:MAG: SIR2 family protein [Bacteroidales bacterium]|nr:SIR2 family protein [Bacteroidales bacterium]